MRLAILVIVLFGVASGAQAANHPGKPGSGMTDTKCQATWIAESPDGATIARDKLAPYVADLSTSDTNNDGTIDANEFMAGCKGGLIK
jgi:hypothetical protein